MADDPSQTLPTCDPLICSAIPTHPPSCQAMKRDGVEPNAVTQQLMAAVGRHGVQSVESQQMAAAAISAAFAAAGTLLMRAGMW